MEVLCSVFVLLRITYSVLSSFAIILTEKRDLVALLYLSSCCLMAVSVLWLFLMVLCVSLQCVIVIFPDHAHLHCTFSKGFK